MTDQGETAAIVRELASQPDVWRRAVEWSRAPGLPAEGERVAVVGCGSSWFMAQSWASMRESGGHGLTDAATATEVKPRDYDRLVAISRSGTTSEIVDLLKGNEVSATLITAVGGGPAARYVENEVVLDWADERSIVQTRFATTALMMLRAALGDDGASVIGDAERAMQATLPQSWIDAQQITFLGTGWTVGLAHEAALKLRESSQSWAESYPAMEYRHGPISIAEPGRVVWVMGPVPPGLAEQIRRTGAEIVTPELDPLAQLVLVHRLAVARARARGLDPDRPRALSRAVILPDPGD